VQKINQKNTWDLDLIDHLTDIIRAEDDNNTETNFQMVSCLLFSMSLSYEALTHTPHTRL